MLVLSTNLAILATALNTRQCCCVSLFRPLKRASGVKKCGKEECVCLAWWLLSPWLGPQPFERIREKSFSCWQVQIWFCCRKLGSAERAKVVTVSMLIQVPIGCDGQNQESKIFLYAFKENFQSIPNLNTHTYYILSPQSEDQKPPSLLECQRVLLFLPLPPLFALADDSIHLYSNLLLSFSNRERKGRWWWPKMKGGFSSLTYVEGMGFMK